MWRCVWWSLVVAQLAWPNSCKEPTADPSEEFERNDVVFSGQITAVELKLPGDSADEFFDRVRFRIEDVWKGDLKGTAELWYPSSGYDIRYISGSTALIYASRDEKGRLRSRACGRGGAIMESGTDLVYFYFLKHRPKASTRFFGFVTTQEKEVNALPRIWTDPPHGARGITLMLEGPGGKHYTETNFHGSFVLDGLVGGEYTMTLYGPDFLLQNRILKSGIKLNVPAKGFFKREIFIPKDLIEKE